MSIWHNLRGVLTLASFSNWPEEVFTKTVQFLKYNFIGEKNESHINSLGSERKDKHHDRIDV